MAQAGRRFHQIETRAPARRPLQRRREGRLLGHGDRRGRSQLGEGTPQSVARGEAGEKPLDRSSAASVGDAGGVNAVARRSSNRNYRGTRKGARRAASLACATNSATPITEV